LSSINRKLLILDGLITPTTEYDQVLLIPGRLRCWIAGLHIIFKQMPKLEIRKSIAGIVGFLLLVCVECSIADTTPMISPITVDDIQDSGTNDPHEQSDYLFYRDYDPCAMTAYGEPLFYEEDSSVFFQIADAEAEYQRARMAFLFGNYEYAYRTWEPLAYQGYAKAQATLAWMFHTGKGVSKNMQTALAWYRVAADNDHAIAQNNLGVFYEQGIEVRKSYRAAAKWYKKAAEVGYPYAQHNLGVLYLEGKGVKKSKDEAIYWLQIASLQGVKQANVLLEELGQQAAPKDKTHQTKPKKRYHGAKLPGDAPDKTKGSSWLAAQNPEHYTLYLAGSYDLASLMSVAQSIPNQSDVAFYEVNFKGRSWFTLIYGEYENAQSAKKALKKLPDEIQKWSPLVRKFADMQKALESSD
jgi:TPR repeat protein